MSQVLKHRDYFQVAEQNLEAIRTDLWDVSFTVPKPIYNPGPDLIKRRLNTISLGSPQEPQNITKEILGHEISSPGGRKSQPADVELSFVDREDHAITFMIQDWRDQTGDPDTGFGRHKSEMLVEELTVYFYNTLLKPYRKIVYYHGLYTGSSLPQTVGDHGSEASDVTLTIHFAHHKSFLL